MTLAEFKAWFEGFTEDMDGAPNEKQFKKIRAKVKQIDGAVTTYPVFVERYRPYWPSQIPGVWYSANTAAETKAVTYSEGTVFKGNNDASLFNVSSAMHDLGKAEYRAMQ